MLLLPKSKIGKWGFYLSVTFAVLFVIALPIGAFVIFWVGGELLFPQ